MPLLVKYEQTDSYFSWLSKQLQAQLSRKECGGHYMHAHLTASFFKKTPHILLSSQNQNQPPLTQPPLHSLSYNQPALQLFEQTLSKPSQTRTSTSFTWLPQQAPAKSARVPAGLLQARDRRFKFEGRLQFPAHYRFSGPHVQVLGSTKLLLWQLFANPSTL